MQLQANHQHRGIDSKSYECREKEIPRAGRLLGGGEPRQQVGAEQVRRNTNRKVIQERENEIGKDPEPK